MSGIDQDERLPTQDLYEGFPFVVSLKSGERRYLHASRSLVQIMRDFEKLKAEKRDFLYFDGAKWSDQDEGYDCAGFVRVEDVDVIGYADPATYLMMLESVARIDGVHGGPSKEESPGEQSAESSEQPAESSEAEREQDEAAKIAFGG